MINVRTVCCLLLALLAGAQSVVGQQGTEKPAVQIPSKLDIYLLIGQSNMAGRASFTQKESDPIARCFLLDDKSKWVPASNPLNRFSTIRKNLNMQRMNPGFGFAKTLLAKDPKIQIGLVVNAKGGTRIEQWAKGTPFYNDAVARTKLAMKTGRLKGILWHQGEGNASMPTAYLPKLKKLIQDLRTDLKSPDVPFVAGQIKGDEAINIEIAKLPKTIPHTGFASSKGLTTFDKWHFDSKSMKLLGERYALEILRIQSSNSTTSAAVDSLSTRKNFEFADHRAFVMIPEKLEKDSTHETLIPWVWYAPTLGKNLPGSAEKWMFDRFHRAGIAIAGIDVGESYGSPNGSKTFEEFYQHLVTQKGFSKKPVLLARSRGGLMLYSWAADHPKSVGGIAGIYPVCNLASYPGIKNASGAYNLKPDELEKRLSEFNPIDRLKPLAQLQVPIHHIHGDSDKVVPLKFNSAIVEARYKQWQAPVEIEVVKGQGHNMWKGWFTSEKLVQFVLKNAK